jgi:MSHA biogenesis protein MshK
MRNAPTHRMLLLAWAFLGAAVSAPCRAQGLPDPTRPPEAVMSPAGAEAAKAPAGLQTIIRREGAKPAAIINGQYVELGGKVGDARLVRVGEDSVLLQGSEGQEELKLFPGVDKTAAKAAKKNQGAAKRKAHAPARKNNEAGK